MRTLLALFILLTLIWGCASVEPATEQESEEEAPEETDSAVPGWFDPLVTSSADSVSVYGFALASAVDSSEAVLLAENIALNNLRYEIDYLAENTRKMLVEEDNNGAYSDVSFIKELRNSVRDLPLSDANIDLQIDPPDSGIYNVYAKASLSKNSLWNLVSAELNNSDFVNAMRSSSSE